MCGNSSSSSIKTFHQGFVFSNQCTTTRKISKIITKDLHKFFHNLKDSCTIFFGGEEGEGRMDFDFFRHEKCYFNILKKFMGKMSF
jgi:hypothetical protein